MESEYEKARKEIANILKNKQRDSEERALSLQREEHEVREAEKILDTWFQEQRLIIDSILAEANDELLHGGGIVNPWTPFSETEEYGVSGFENERIARGIKTSLEIQDQKKKTKLCVFLNGYEITIGLRSPDRESYFASSSYNETIESNLTTVKIKEAVINGIVAFYK